MAALAPIATIAATGVSLYAANEQRNAQKKAARVQQENAQIRVENQQAAQEQQQQVLAAQAAADNAQRQRALARSVASARARLGASGINPNTGSAAALTEGLRTASAVAQNEDDAVYAARMANGRRSLLVADPTYASTLQAWARAGQSTATALKSLLS
ncbi:hypothetical protein [Muricoccus radiodurans]|uniref:hypothetical protein n=1 Tax=Muricoccus radiodurans TaxID=2231721 RepID=UPI003CE7CC23